MPAELRRLWNIVKNGKVTVTLSKTGKSAIMEPVPDLLSLGGSLHKYANVTKGMTSDQIIKTEKEAVGDAIVERYLRKERRSGKKLLVI
jgi:hypothetical protein